MGSVARLAPAAGLAPARAVALRSTDVGPGADMVALTSLAALNKHLDMKSVIPLPPQALRFMAEDDARFVSIGNEHLDFALRYVIPTSVLDIGCGYGRFAYALRARGFKGRYTGVDVLERQIDWLNEHFVDPGYRFTTVDIQNDRYNPQGATSADGVRLPEVAPDLITVLSVFTHMYDRDIEAYLRAIRAALTPDGVAYVTAFILGGERRNPFDAKHRIADHCYTANPDDPLHVIAYDEAWLRRTIDAAGLELRDLVYGYQDRLVLTPRS